MGRLKKALHKEKYEQKLAHAKSSAEKRQKEMEKAKKLKNQTHQRPKARLPFDTTHKVLLVGEGDFSFAYALASGGLCTDVIATAYDSEQAVREKYPSTAERILGYLNENDIPIHYEVDATALLKTKQIKALIGDVDVVMFNFPHIGNSIKDQARNILQHQKLVLGYFESALGIIKPGGKIALTLFEGEPYLSWNIKKLARESGLKVERSDQFAWDAYPGYSHRLTAKEGKTSKPQISRPARTYVFVKYEKKE